MQGVSQAVEAAEESVEELAAAGQDYEAQILKGVEDATDHPGKPVPNRGGEKRRGDAPPDRRAAWHRPATERRLGAESA